MNFSANAYYLAAAVVAVTASALMLLRPKKKMRPSVNSSEVVLYIFPRWKYGPNASPACEKLETFLRLAKIPYTTYMKLQSGPTGRWPYIAHLGEYISDSGSCVSYLRSAFNPTMDSHLTPQQVATGVLITRTLEQASYFHVVRSRWVDNFPIYSKLLVLPIPAFLNGLVFRVTRREMIKTLNAQGCGDRSDTEYVDDLIAELEAIVQFLPPAGLFYGGHKKPSSFDATLYAYLHSLSAFPYKKEAMPRFMTVVTSPAVQSYLSFVQSQAFPDFDEVIKQTASSSWKP